MNNYIIIFLLSSKLQILIGAGVGACPSKDRIYNKLAEMLELGFRREHTFPKLLVARLHEKIPCEIDRSLLCDTLVPVLGSGVRFFLGCKIVHQKRKSDTRRQTKSSAELGTRAQACTS
jgi:hypothetical protein